MRQDLCDEIAFDVNEAMSEPLVLKLPSPDSSDSDSNSDFLSWLRSARTKTRKFKWFCELCLSFQPKCSSSPYHLPEQTKPCLNCRIGSFLVLIDLSANEAVTRAYRCHVDGQHADEVIGCQSHADDDDDDDNYSYDDDDSDSDSDDDDDYDGIHRPRPDCGSKVSDSSRQNRYVKTKNSPQRHPVSLKPSSRRKAPFTPDLPFPLRSFTRLCVETAQDFMTMHGTPQQYLPYAPQQKIIL